MARKTLSLTLHFNLYLSVRLRRLCHIILSIAFRGEIPIHHIPQIRIWKIANHLFFHWHACESWCVVPRGYRGESKKKWGNNFIFTGPSIMCSHIPQVVWDSAGLRTIQPSNRGKEKRTGCSANDLLKSVGDSLCFLFLNHCQSFEPPKLLDVYSTDRDGEGERKRGRELRSEGWKHWKGRALMKTGVDQNGMGMNPVSRVLSSSLEVLLLPVHILHTFECINLWETRA